MRILLASSASHLPPRGGSTRSNLAWLDQLSASGHACRVVAGALTADTPEKLAQARRELEDQQIDRASIEIHSIAEPVRRADALKEQIGEFQPDWVLVSSEDIGQALLRAAHEAAPGRVVYLAHTPQFYPFGPASWNPHREGTELVARAAAVVAIGQHTADYIRKYASCRVEVIHPPIYGSGPFAQSGSLDDGLVTMINPCAVKGISIFLALAERFPERRFAALPGWGTTAADLRALAHHPNVTLVRHSKNIDGVLEQTRVLLMPSVWFEGFGLIVVESMLRGIPVVASDAGGLVEAKLGTNFVIPIRPVERYEAVFDDQGLPRAVLPEQDLTPWAAALEALFSDRQLYERESASSRAAALHFVSGLRPSQLQEFLAALAPGEPLAHPSETLAHLSADKRALLLQRLRAAASKAPRGS
jgi:glycosyltransferase involved in cell wall biosynthesis